MKQNSAQVLLEDRTYNVLSVVNGGMGRVWLLEQAFEYSFNPILCNKLAVKTFDFMKNETIIEDELNIWITFNNEFILPLKKIGRLNFQLAAIMPLMNGNLNRILESKGPIGEKETAQILLNISMGLNYAWSKYKVLHLDIKPSNVLINSLPLLSLKISDWGISRIATDEYQTIPVKIAPDHSLMNDKFISYSGGTPLYMAPERFSGKWAMNPRVDIYSLGMIAIELNTGTLPFNAGNFDPINEIFNYNYYLNAIQLLKNSSKLFQEFCLRCINPNPDKRFNCYDEVLMIIKKLIKKG